MVRGPYAEPVIIPKFGLVMFVTGLPRPARLNALMKSARISKFADSVKRNFLLKLKSSDTRMGPRTFGRYRGAVPGRSGMPCRVVGTCGKAATLRYWLPAT